MYLRPAFTVTDLDRISALIASNPFGLLITLGPAGLDASHLPFTLTREGDRLTLDAHLAAANAQSASLDGGTALAVFTGPHAYIAPSWYETQPSVPTWDYAAVHLHGSLEVLQDPSDGLASLAADDPGGFHHSSLPDAYRSAMFKGITPFRLHPTRIEAQWKMSQNRSQSDRLSVISALRQRGDTAVADLIAATLNP